MGNVEAHDFAPVRADERKVLNLSRKVTPKQYVKHLKGDHHESCLTELPWNIRDSVSLYETMTVAFNAISELPVELPLRLPHLSVLDISHNQLRELPKSFGLFFHLREIYLQHNRLQSLPETFVHLVKLEKVDMSYNELRQLPEDLGDMEKLERINVVHNKLKTLPLSLGNPASRVNLLLAHQNRLQSPPQAICDEGSSQTLNILRKQFCVQRDSMPAQPAVPLNQFPRHCFNRPERSVNNPHSAQIQYIQEQTNTSYTTNRIKAPLLPPQDATKLTPFELRDRVIGLIYGAAIGDAIGLACRWMSEDECAFHYPTDADLVYSKISQDVHRVLWRQGDWTSNFDQFLLLLDSLTKWGGVVDELEFANKLCQWAENGFHELGDSYGVVTSETITEVMHHEKFGDHPHDAASLCIQEHREKQQSTDSDNTPETPTTNGADTPSPPPSPGLQTDLPDLPTVTMQSPLEVVKNMVYIAPRETFGVDNGAIVRSAILGIPSFHELHEVESNAVRICKTTHADGRCVASSVLVSFIISLLLQGKLITDIGNGLRSVSEEQLNEIFQRASKHLPNQEQREEFLALKSFRSFTSFNARSPSHMSHTYTPLKAALLALHWKDDYRSFVTVLTKLAGDSNSNSCVAGAVLGCYWGYSRLPTQWVTELRKPQKKYLNIKINHLLDVIGLP